jgi:hypothetical protein
VEHFKLGAALLLQRGSEPFQRLAAGGEVGLAQEHLRRQIAGQALHHARDVLGQHAAGNGDA